MSAMPQVSSICSPCKARVLSQLRSRCNRSLHTPSNAWRTTILQTGERQPRCEYLHGQPAKISSVNFRKYTTDSTSAQNRDGVDAEHGSLEQSALPKDDLQPEEVENEVEDIQLSFEEERELSRAALDPAAVAQYARKRFRDRLPEGALTPEEYKHYERMYGPPLEWSEEHEMTEEELEARARDLEKEEEEMENALLREGADGELQEIEGALEIPEDLSEEELDLLQSSQESDDVEPRLDASQVENEADRQLRLDMQASMGEEAAMALRDNVDENRTDGDEENAELRSGEEYRAHPFTLSARSGTNPVTIQIPKEALAGPVGGMIADTSNKHLDEMAERLFGGKGLPYSTGTPAISRSLPQKPIPITTSQGRMAPMEANIFLAALGGGMYASTMSVLVELRRRLGSRWLRSLMEKEDGPRILDTGSGGVGVLAWREIIKAEWARTHDQERSPAPVGKATVLTGSDALRQRASLLLENTTFLPRLPDYIHVTDHDSTQRKQFDIIIAPYALWHIQEDYLRRQYVENLWSLLDPNGGVLVILEKGVPRGFEVVAGAREYLINSLFKRPASKESLESPPNPRKSHEGAIIAPCTNHSKCPMYPVPGISRQRKDYCHFSQRYERPKYYQRMLGAKTRNHEDVRYSYVAVQKGVHPEDVGAASDEIVSGKRLMGHDATTRAFEGFDVHDADLRSNPEQGYQTPVTAGTSDSTAMITSPPTSAHPNPLSLPRIILPPLKRHGHVMLDVCTPSGTLERWTVARSFGKQAFRDARKSDWGDLWALGAKGRVPRNVRLGKNARGEEDMISESDQAAVSKKQVRVARRKEEKKTGRLKARERKREERSKIEGV